VLLVLNDLQLLLKLILDLDEIRFSPPQKLWSYSASAGIRILFFLR
jgi:hypothetical protein